MVAVTTARTPAEAALAAALLVLLTGAVVGEEVFVELAPDLLRNALMIDNIALFARFKP